jgi:hypothetical protein
MADEGSRGRHTNGGSVTCAGKAELVLFVCTGNEFSACSVPERAVRRVQSVYIERVLEAGKWVNEGVLGEQDRKGRKRL